jgi:hypothetical protein
MTHTKHESPKPPQPGTHEQSGSTGRNAPEGKKPQGADTGQGRYGQSGIADGQPRETDGQAQYKKSEHAGDPHSKHRSNRGSGRADADETADIPKTG